MVSDIKSIVDILYRIKSAMYATGEDANHFKELDILDSPQSMNYEPGSVFKLNGKEYVLSENHTLDIPYGEDLWCLEYPSNYRFCEKID